MATALSTEAAAAGCPRHTDCTRARLARAQDWAVHLEQDAARGRELAAAYVQANRSGASWGETEVAMDRLMEWVEGGEEE